MKKQILTLGKALNRAEQKEVIGGDHVYPVYPFHLVPGSGCGEDPNEGGMTYAECVATCPGGNQGACVPCSATLYTCDYRFND